MGFPHLTVSISFGRHLDDSMYSQWFKSLLVEMISRLDSITHVIIPVEN